MNATTPPGEAYRLVADNLAKVIQGKPEVLPGP